MAHQKGAAPAVTVAIASANAREKVRRDALPVILSSTAAPFHAGLHRPW
jgi:hypothetical protein